MVMGRPAQILTIPHSSPCVAAHPDRSVPNYREHDAHRTAAIGSKTDAGEESIGREDNS